MKKHLIIIIAAIAVIMQVTASEIRAENDTATSGADSDSTALAEASLTYAPVSNYDVTQKRAHLNTPGFGYIPYTSIAPLPKGFEDYYFAPLANSISIMDWSKRRYKEKNCAFVDIFQGKPNNDPIVWEKDIPESPNDLLYGVVGVAGDEGEMEISIVLRGIESAKARYHTNRITVAKRTRQKAKQAGASLGSSSAYGKAIGSSDDVDGEMVVLGAGGQLGYSWAWIAENADVIIYAYNDPIPSITAEVTNQPPEFLVSPILMDFDRDDQKNGKPIEEVYRNQIKEIAKAGYARWENGDKGFFFFIGVCSTPGAEKYNMGDLGPRRAKRVMYLVMAECEKLGMPIEVFLNTAVFLSAGESNIDNEKFYFKKDEMNQRVDVAWAEYMTALPRPELMFEDSQEVIQ